MSPIPPGGQMVNRRPRRLIYQLDVAGRLYFTPPSSAADGTDGLALAAAGRSVLWLVNCCLRCFVFVVSISQSDMFISDTTLHRVTEKTGSFDISSYLCFGSYELHENFQKYI